MAYDNSKTLEIPADLDATGKKIAKTILAVATKLLGEQPYTGGCPAFYSPKAWTARGESYGLKSKLVVVYDGGEMALFFDWDRGDNAWREKMDSALREIGYYAECCTGWYSAIYPI